MPAPSTVNARSCFILPAALSLTGCFVGDEFPRDATRAEAGEMLAACHFHFARVAPQDAESDHLIVDILEKEPDRTRKEACLRSEIDRRQVSLGTAGPLPS